MIRQRRMSSGPIPLKETSPESGEFAQSDNRYHFITGKRSQLVGRGSRRDPYRAYTLGGSGGSFRGGPFRRSAFRDKLGTRLRRR